MRIKRNNLVVVLGVFVAVFVFAFLTAKYKGSEDADAADLGKFDPGYIISDYQMGNYNSMSEADIQAFLTAKNPCNNTNYDYYLQLSSSFTATWHFENGHFVCLSEERFGNNDGEIGFQYGESAAHIIWQAAQDYKINPQVLIVLLQKETGMITDQIPNNYDYRKATGYGCPDTAACSSKYYGFKNQIRNAAALFRTVLDGGWTNYPLGENYVQYNPNSGCGGSVVNIRSLATSALYRYTPYQPNAAALAAGYGTGDGCSAYGNRNFYNYFEDWFGGAVSEVRWYEMETPRYMVANQDIERINPDTGMSVGESIIKKGQIVYYSTKALLGSDVCLRTKHNTENNIRACVLMDYLDEIRFDFMPEKKDKYLVIGKNNKKINFRTNKDIMEIENAIIRRCAGEVTFLGKTYYITEFDAYDINEIESGFLKGPSIKEYEKYQMYDNAKSGVILNNTFKKDLMNGYNSSTELTSGQYIQFLGEIMDDKKKYYITRYDIMNDNAIGVLGNEIVFYEKLEKEKTIVLNDEITRFKPITNTIYDKLEKGRVLTVTSFIVLNDKRYYRTKYNTEYDMNVVLDIEED